eukprot:scaffold528_cov165-Amphora_coffeaeformis.AAC.65
MSRKDVKNENEDTMSLMHEWRSRIIFEMGVKSRLARDSHTKRTKVAGIINGKIRQTKEVP